jgi:YggT family protein
MRIIMTLINFVIGFIEILLSLRFIFRFFGASANSPFVNWIYVNSQPFLEPFFNIFSDITVGKFVIELTTILALLAYAIVGYIISYLIRALITPNHTHI